MVTDALKFKICAGEWPLYHMEMYDNHPFQLNITDDTGLLITVSMQRMPYQDIVISSGNFDINARVYPTLYLPSRDVQNVLDQAMQACEQHPQDIILPNTEKGFVNGMVEAHFDSDYDSVRDYTYERLKNLLLELDRHFWKTGRWISLDSWIGYRGYGEVDYIGDFSIYVHYDVGDAKSLKKIFKPNTFQADEGRLNIL